MSASRSAIAATSLRRIATTSFSRAALPLHRQIIPASVVRSRGFATTPSRYAKPLPPRSEKYKKLTKEDVEAFKAITSGVLSTLEGASTANEDDLKAFNEDWM